MSRDDWWRHASKEEQLAELERMGHAHSRRRKELEARYPLLDADGWIASIEQKRSGPWQWAAAVSFVGLPLGHEGSGLVLLSTPSTGRLWWSARSGMFMVPLEV